MPGRHLAAALVFMVATAARADAPEDAYFAARDAAIARAEAATNPVDAYARETVALEPLLQTLIGPVLIKGFVGPGRFNKQSNGGFSADFGPLDGLALASPDGKTHLVVTTEGVFRRWLAAYKDWWGAGKPNVPQAPEAALRTGTFYSEAFESNGAYTLYGELPVASPRGSAIALLAAASAADTPPPAPDTIIVGAIVDGRVLIAHAPMRATIAPAAACAKAWAAAQPKIDAATNAYTVSSLQNHPQPDTLLTLQTEAETAFRKCHQAAAQKQKGFADAGAQAQALIDAIAAQ